MIEQGVKNISPIHISANTELGFYPSYNHFIPQSPSASNKSSEPKFESPTGKRSRFYFDKELSQDEKKRVEELKRKDAKVRAHEMAHLAAGGALVRGGANFTYEIGPDGKQYAVAGEVKIDMSSDPNDPEKTIRKMQQVRRAALAPVDPSPQDRSVAQQASNIESQMRAKMLQEKSQPNHKLLVYSKYEKNLKYKRRN